MSSATAALWHPDFAESGIARDEISDPWAGERMADTWRAIEESGLPHRLIQPRPASRDIIELVHPPHYVDTIRDYAEGVRARNDDFSIVNADTAIRSNSYHLAALAVGAVCEGIDAVVSGSARNAFLIARPGDHHAYAQRGGGFCLLNHTAVGARYAQERHGLSRVLIIDWDVHHGQGTQAIFSSDPSVYYYSIHQFGAFYPYSGHETERGTGAGQGRTLNVNVPAGTVDHVFLREFRRGLNSISFEPDLVLITAGFDGHRDDPVGGLRLTEEIYPELTRLVMDYADEHCGGRIVSFPAGGYNLETYPGLVLSHVRALTGEAA
jgi:acetoin utilization deacetylase AcuC-like enzyme